FVASMFLSRLARANVRVTSRTASCALLLAACTSQSASPSSAGFGSELGGSDECVEQTSQAAPPFTVAQQALVATDGSVDVGLDGGTSPIGDDSGFESTESGGDSADAAASPDADSPLWPEPEGPFFTLVQ